MASIQRLAALGSLLFLVWSTPGFAQPPMDITDISVVKSIDRFEGSAFDYKFEACVNGVSILSGSVDTPGGVQSLVVDPDDPTTLCFEEHFASQAALDGAYPISSSYQFDLSGASAESDSKTLTQSESAPGVFATIVNPANGTGGVPTGPPLSIDWTLTATGGCTPCGTCGDGIEIHLSVDDVDVFAPTVPICDTTVNTPAGTLVEAANHELDVRPFVGSTVATTTDGGDPVDCRTAYEDNDQVVFSTAPAVPALGWPGWILAAGALGAVAAAAMRARAGAGSGSR